MNYSGNLIIIIISSKYIIEFPMKIGISEKIKKPSKPVRVYGIYGTISDIFNERE